MPRGDLSLTVKHKKQVIEIIEKYHRKIGTEGYTAEKLQMEMRQELNRCDEEMLARKDTVAPGENNEPPSIAPPLPPVVPDAPDGENNTPKAALLKLAEAYKALDLNGIVANFYMDRKDEIYIEEMLMYDLTIDRFDRKLKAAYSSVELKAAGFTLSDETNYLTPEDIGNMTFSVSGNTAIATGEDGTSIELIKKDGRWLVVFHDELPPAEDREKIRSRAMVIDRILNGLMPKIGAKGVTAQSLHEEYEAEMRKAMESFEK